MAKIASNKAQRTTETTLNKITGHIYFVQNLENNEKINSETIVIAKVLWVTTTVYITQNIPTV